MSNISTYTIEYFDNHNSITWSIWGLLTGLLLFVLIASIIFFSINYIKNNKKFLTIKKVAYLSIFLGMFIVQAFCFKPFLELPIPFSFDSIWVIAVAFIFGPLEGIMFGWIADSLRVLINGWTYQLLPSLMYPIIGLIAGITGYIYSNKDTINRKTMIISFQFLMVTVFLITIPALLGINYLWDNITINNVFDQHYGYSGISKIATIITTLIVVIIIFILMEVIFVWFIRSEKRKEDLLLFMLLSISAFADRGMELVIRPFTQYFSGYEQIYWVSLITRMISTTYLVPTVALTSFWLVKASRFAMNIE